MFTKEQLANWREQGFEFDDFHDKVAVEKKEENIIIDGSVKAQIISKAPHKFGDTLVLQIETTGIAKKKPRITIELYDDDSALGVGNDVLLYKSVQILEANVLKVSIPLTEEMQRKFGAWEGGTADCYFKISYTIGTYSEVIETPIIKISYNAALAYDAYIEQKIMNPSGKKDVTHKDSVLVLNEKRQTIAFITPDEKLFVWVKDTQWEGYFENGIRAYRNLYIYYVEDAIRRQTEPVSWGIYLANRDAGQFVVDILDNPNEVLMGLAGVLKKVVTLDFDIEATWERILEASPTDATYVVSSMLMTMLGSVKSSGIVNGVRKQFAPIAKHHLHKFAEILEYHVGGARLGISKMTLPELFALFAKAIKFERMVTEKLLELYPKSQGYIHIPHLYLSVNGVVSIADNCIYNTNTEKWILNESKFGVGNTLRTNQAVIQNAIKANAPIKVKSTKKWLKDLGISPKVVEYDRSIKFDKILRSNNTELKITAETIKQDWP